MSQVVVLSPAELGNLLEIIRQDGFQLVGPTLRDGAIVYAEIESLDELPVGWTEVQDAGRYRLQRREDNAYFGYNVGPHSWKQFLFVPHLRLWSAQRNGKSFTVDSQRETPPQFAFVGVRSCDLHAIGIQDQVFRKGPFVDSDYEARRRTALIIAVNCGQSVSTCFCVSMQTGPRADAGFDLAVTELLDPSHRFLVELGSERGRLLLARVTSSDVTLSDLESGDEVVAEAAGAQRRRLDTTDIQALLYANLDHARWDEVASRCLTCANCTMACPTCFCSTVEDVTDLTGDHAERWRRWDSCFTVELSRLHGGSVRSTAKSRYRQWLSHKLASWQDQYGTSGCVGCGRCITWCPVGIDLTEEVAAIRELDSRDPSRSIESPHGIP